MHRTLREMHELVKCAICRRTMIQPARPSECQHFFCRGCLVESARVSRGSSGSTPRSQALCPVCRVSIRNLRSIVSLPDQHALARSFLALLAAFNNDLSAIGTQDNHLLISDSQLPTEQDLNAPTQPYPSSPTPSSPSSPKVFKRPADAATGLSPAPKRLTASNTPLRPLQDIQPSPRLHSIALSPIKAAGQENAETEEKGQGTDSLKTASVALSPVKHIRREAQTATEVVKKASKESGSSSFFSLLAEDKCCSCSLETVRVLTRDAETELSESVSQRVQKVTVDTGIAKDGSDLAK